MKKIKAKKITAENFKAFGTFADFLNPEGFHLGNFYRDQVLFHSSGNMQVAFSPLLVHKPEKMIVEKAEFHNYTQEASVCLDDDIVVHVAPASKEPVPECTEAFIVPQGTMICLRPGVWHLSAMPMHKETAHVMIVLPERTYHNDCTVVTYSDDQKVEIEM